MNERMCPCCGSKNYEEKKEVITRKLSNNSIVEFEGVNNICHDCEEEGDFFGSNDKLFLLAKEKEDKRYFGKMLETVKDNGFSLAYIERVLGLPQRTLTRWKSQGVSASGVTLMKLVNTYPWLLKVADKKFDPLYAKRELIQQAAICFSTSINDVGGVATGLIWEGGNNTNFTMNVSVSNPEPKSDSVNVIANPMLTTNLKYGT